MNQKIFNTKKPECQNAPEVSDYGKPKHCILFLYLNFYYVKHLNEYIAKGLKLLQSLCNIYFCRPLTIPHGATIQQINSRLCPFIPVERAPNGTIGTGMGIGTNDKIARFSMMLQHELMTYPHTVVNVFQLLLFHKLSHLLVGFRRINTILRPIISALPLK